MGRRGTGASLVLDAGTADARKLQRGGRGLADQVRAFAETVASGLSPRALDLDAGAGAGNLRRGADDRLSYAGESGGAARGGAGGELIRAAFGTQLGMRRFYGFGGGDRRFRSGGRGVCGAESAPRDCEPTTV